MQMNQALFLAGGHCGYVLQPNVMRDEAFDPFDKSSLRGLEPCAICIEVGRGRSAGLFPGTRAWGLANTTWEGAGQSWGSRERKPSSEVGVGFRPALGDWAQCGQFLALRSQAVQ